MGILRLLYVILHFFITYIHNLHVALSELVDRIKPVIKDRTYHWPADCHVLLTATTVKLGANIKDESLLLQKIGSELKRLDKLPIHVACLLTETDVNIDRMIVIIQWFVSMGVYCISLYDHEGCIASCQDEIKIKLKGLVENLPNGLRSKSIAVYKGFVKKEFFSSDSINIFLMNHYDGKSLFTQVAQRIVDELNYSQIDQSVVEQAINQFYPKEPELMVQFGSLLSNTTLGYSPWHLRLTQMMRAPNHTRLRVDHIVSTMLEYGSCQQRFGK
ncbi:NOGO-B receptor [Daphnia magna]|uniref:ditrans,polycis-polyprenyl diphosphate synthase [(2E,6E)-farnesyldiphosphate specific] n=2 Tax=Daphnia magna TaxID=35525 RepID=A0A0P6IP66_9CRUS|nr:hypothetical protein OUZ56_007261 [Daphnia magna]KZS21275.1 NOGO-B receptor [Daphnia magna]